MVLRQAGVVWQIEGVRAPGKRESEGLYGWTG
jgi:hypothetical protein